MREYIDLPRFRRSAAWKVLASPMIVLLLSPITAAAAVPCTTCHAAAAESLSGSPHDPSTAAPGGDACVTCHGSAEAHLASPSRETIGRIIDKTPAEQEAICHQCHGGMQKSTNHPTTGAGIGCVSCHDIHKKKAR